LNKIRQGFIGLGDQGAPIARRIIDAGFPMVLWARRAASLEPFIDTSAKIVSSIAELANQVDQVGICVVDDLGTEQVCSELIPVMHPGSCIVIHSTVNPKTCEALAEQAKQQNISLIDAPVSGGRQVAEMGKMTVMVGGDKQAFEKAKTVFESFATLIVHLGDVGAGQQAKLINNTVFAAHLAIAYQGLEAASTLKLDKLAFTDLINASSGRSYGFEVLSQLPNPSLIKHGTKLLAKDIGILNDILGNSETMKIFKQITEPFIKNILDTKKASSSHT
jgi:3-hydroxyisobutyrate dehydrogenase